ncbi:hypothetical protein F4808DRAFT_218650 [Astrocystis sublimbata]|nr:hypothetical protein F4808DRAFT_218650 [Astrocystis sublimbata]
MSDIIASNAMALRYSAEFLIHLRDSPLCVKPANLPPAEEWMGPPPDSGRTTTAGRTGTERNPVGSFTEQPGRRVGIERHVSRNSASTLRQSATPLNLYANSMTDADDIVLGPPRTMFNSATLSRTTKTFDNDKTAAKDSETRAFPFRTRHGDNDGTEHFRDREREGRNNLRPRRGDGEESDGWSTVKPRKSFGAEGAERFHGRMGDRRPREGDDRDNNPERPRRGFGDFAKDKEGDEGDKLRRTGLNRARSDNPWERNNLDVPQTRERFDRSKSWRDRAAAADDHPDTQHDRPRERQYDRRWDREPRQEREPEWLDEPMEEPQAHTQEDFKKFMDTMKAKAAPEGDDAPALSQDVLGSRDQGDVDGSKARVAKAAPPIELGQDKFFAAFAKTGLEGNGDIPNENAAPTPKPKTGSRFQSFFNVQEQARHQPEPPSSAPPPPPAAEMNPLLALAGGLSKGNPNMQADATEKVAFQALLAKLQKQTREASTPPSGGFAEPPPSQDFGPKNVMASPGSFRGYGQDPREEPMARGPPHGQDMHPLPPQQGSPFAAMRPEQQVLHELIGQRHPSQSFGGNRADQPPSRNSNPNTEFLVSLMQGGRNMSETPRNNDPLVMRMPQPSRPVIPPTPDRETDFQHEHMPSQHQGNVRPNEIPSFFNEQPLHRQEREVRPQPTHILQRPGQGPPGLEQMPLLNNWLQAGGQPQQQQQQPPQQQMPQPGNAARGPMIPPPGLAGAQQQRINGPGGPGIPVGSFGHFHPMGGFPLPGDGMSGPPGPPHAPPPPGPPRNMAPPPGFFGGPLNMPGFMPHPAPGLGRGFNGPDSFGFDGRAMPPPGNGPFRRN